MRQPALIVTQRHVAPATQPPAHLIGGVIVVENQARKRQTPANGAPGGVKANQVIRCQHVRVPHPSVHSPSTASSLPPAVTTTCTAATAPRCLSSGSMSARRSASLAARTASRGLSIAFASADLAN